MIRPRLLDLFCGAGGAAAGYHRAGFDVTGIDHRPQPRYPFAFEQADALAYLQAHGCDFDAIHASPPCQRYSRACFGAPRVVHPDLVPPVRALLLASSRPWVIENVPGAPLSPYAITLCGLMFGLKVLRHRCFESSNLLLAPAHPSHHGVKIGQDGWCCVVGHGGGVSRRTRALAVHHGTGGQQDKAAWELAMGIDWMTRNELAQAIPPAYTHYLGKQLLRVLHEDSCA